MGTVVGILFLTLTLALTVGGFAFALHNLWSARSTCEAYCVRMGWQFNRRSGPWWDRRRYSVSLPHDPQPVVVSWRTPSKLSTGSTTLSGQVQTDAECQLFPAQNSTILVRASRSERGKELPSLTFHCWSSSKSLELALQSGRARELLEASVASIAIQSERASVSVRDLVRDPDHLALLFELFALVRSLSVSSAATAQRPSVG